jgi:hypothetical protein
MAIIPSVGSAPKRTASCSMEESEEALATDKRGYQRIIFVG